MARSMDDIVKEMLGGAALASANLMAQLEKAQEELAALKAEKEKEKE